ncbi:glutathione S-transferase C-terminal domain-containing protein [Cupriavidus respiraculi]|uniref:glutathione S-transferase family protein n=1 Tax=Cupriavidus respiraculi TaxID=195930 RepID=UPI001C943683|nr:glutathione S-transferase [Cupriavidus respiraculi]MBY4946329.1 glutathione S-transferase C-terminal domain-containing protein [Cupriavidus respiraculi]
MAQRDGAAEGAAQSSAEAAADTAEYLLYCFAQSGNAYKVAQFLETVSVQRGRKLWTPRFVDYFHGETHTPEYRAINVMGEVPVLEFDGTRLTQSGAILLKLAGRLGAFAPADEAERDEVLRWLLFDNHKFTSYTATYRFLRAFAKAPDPAVLEFLRTRCEGAWNVLNTHLGGRAFVLGEHASIADFSLAGYVFFDDEIGVHWRKEYPHVHAWMERMRAMPGWKHPYDLMPGHPVPKAPQ